jgi:hypothetical protein
MVSSHRERYNNDVRTVKREDRILEAIDRVVVRVIFGTEVAEVLSRR